MIITATCNGQQTLTLHHKALLYFRSGVIGLKSFFVIVYIHVQFVCGKCCYMYTRMEGTICERISEKGPLCAEAEFLFSIAHIFKAVTATGFQAGIVILQSLHYTRCKFHALSTSGSGVVVASVTHGQKSANLCLTLEPHRFR